jgi:TRAP-type mannitol/chloroaromatic compound transport system permease small subunit
VSSWLLVGLIFLGGPWALARGHFVRVDALYSRFPPRMKAIVDSTVSTALFILFVGVLVKLGGQLALRSFAIGETSATGAWDGPVWLAKWLVPVGGVLLTLAWISQLAHAWRGTRFDDGGRRDG